MNNWFKCAFGAAMALAALLAFTPPTSAQTSTCEGESGTSLGLCTSYCQAMDCDSGSPQATETACARVLNNWSKQEGEREIPCEIDPVEGDKPGGGGPGKLTSMCPLDALDIETVCRELNLDAGEDFAVAYFIPGAIDPAGTLMEDSANLCVCLGYGIKQCFPEDGELDPCYSAEPFQGTDVFTETHIGTNSCQYVNYYMFGTWMRLLICDPAITGG